MGRLVLLLLMRQQSRQVRQQLLLLGLQDHHQQQQLSVLTRGQPARPSLRAALQAPARAGWMLVLHLRPCVAAAAAVAGWLPLLPAGVTELPPGQQPLRSMLPAVLHAPQQ
jgi:hypothetical protein